MQSLEWYIHRIRGMSGSELAWRMSMLLQSSLDRVRIPMGAYPTAASHVPGSSIDDLQRGFSLADQFSRDEYPEASRTRLLAAADEIVDHKLSYFQLQPQFLGDPINWHRDHHSKIDTQKGLIQGIDYRDTRYNGDCKHVWEPNRHHQFVVLARAYQASGDIRYATAFAEQINHWIDQNPFGYGMNWRSPLELGVRLINWVWALELVRPSGLICGELWQKIYQNAYLMSWDTQRKYSRGSSANNHLVGEAAGVFVAACYFGSFPQGDTWIREARQILINEIAAQSYDDGCTREQALGYQFFVIQFYLFCGLAGRWSGNEFPESYWSRLRKMIEFVELIADGGPLPLFGDQDDGYVLDLGDHARDVDALLDLAAGVPELGVPAGSLRLSEARLWLCGTNDQRESDAQLARPFSSVAFSDSGYYLLQDDSQGNRISVLFDCAELGYGGIAAHGHADALSFTLRAFGEYLLVDTGTYDYFTEPKMRNYFRTTAAHNTVVIDGRNQSELLGPFMWGERANANCYAWDDNKQFARVAGEHDGYQSLADPVTHKRIVTLERESQRCGIEDKLTMAAEHTVDVYFHFGPDCTVTRQDGNSLVVSVGDRHKFSLALDSVLELRMLRGSEDSTGGWYSSGYHQKVPITTVVGTCQLAESITLRHSINLKDVC